MPFKYLFPSLLLSCLLLAGCGNQPKSTVHTSQPVTTDSPVPSAISPEFPQITPSDVSVIGAEDIKAGDPSRENQLELQPITARNVYQILPMEVRDDSNLYYGILSPDRRFSVVLWGIPEE